MPLSIAHRLCPIVVRCLLAMSFSASSSAAQQEHSIALTPRIGAALHVAGLERSLRPELGRGEGSSWRHQVQPALALGLTASAPLGGTGVELRLDADWVRRAGTLRDPDGPPLVYSATGQSYWTTASVSFAPRILGASHCVSMSAGAGRGFYDYSVGELRGDIGNYFAPKQHTAVLRFGAEARLRVPGLRLSLQVVDYVGTLTPGYGEAERLSPMHTLLISGGIVLGR